ncbi:redoxin domain-containing protein [Xenophilus aerolatus]|nr:redoxin domain-containing protein [Xenophilus aerolatus]
MNDSATPRFTRRAATVATLGWLAGAHAAEPAVPLPDLGPAVEFTGIDRWLGSEPLTMQGLNGKVTLVYFWTFACVNCLNTMPHVVRWYERYRDRGFVVVGVHTPEFAFERVTANVESARDRLGIRFPVAQDNRFATWQAWRNQYWPAFYLVDRAGRVRRKHFGEGEYARMDAAIQTLLAAG